VDRIVNGNSTTDEMQASRWGSSKAPVDTQRSKLASRPMQIRVFIGAWPGEQPGGGSSKATKRPQPAVLDSRSLVLCEG
jgi:hypothetical protein